MRRIVILKSHSEISSSVSISAFQSRLNSRTHSARDIASLRRYRLRVYKEDPLTSSPEGTHIVCKLHEDLVVHYRYDLVERVDFPRRKLRLELHATAQKHSVL